MLSIMPPQPHNHSTPQNPVGRFMVAVGAVIEHLPSGHILVVRRNTDQDWQGGEWEMVYGRIDQHEDPEAGLRREVSEEIGLTDLTIGPIARVWHIYRGPKTAENDLIDITYHCTTHTKHVVLSHEHLDYRWVKPQEALQLVRTVGIKLDIEMFLASRK